MQTPRAPPTKKATRRDKQTRYRFRLAYHRLGHGETLVGGEHDAVATGQVRVVAIVRDVEDLDLVLLGGLDVPAVP